MTAEPPAAGVAHRGIAWLIRSPFAYALILLLGLAIFLPGLRALPAVDRDEARFAQASRQMLESGDFVDIRFQDEARLKKPVGIYWLQAAATALAGGEDPANPVWTYRLPSLIGALTALVLTLAIGRRWLGAEAGFAGAALLASSLLLGFEARQAKTDAVLLAACLAAIAGLAEAWVPTDVPGATTLARWRWIAFWAAIGLGVLIKGPIIVLVTGLAAATLAILDRSVAWLGRLRPWPGVLIALGVALPWLIAITLRSHGAFLEQSLGGDMAAKLADAQESHGAPPGAYLLMLPLTFWPGSLFALLAAPWVWRNRRDRAVQFLLAWLMPAWVAFEAVATKLPHYVLPLYPALALLAGAALSDRLTGPPAIGWRRLPGRATIIVWMMVGLGLGLVVILAAPLGDGRPSVRGIATAALIFGVTAACALQAWRGRIDRAATIAVLGAVPIWGMAFGAALPALEAPWIAPRLQQALFTALPAGHGPVMIAGYGEPSAVLSLGTGVRFGPGAAAAALLSDDPGAVAFVSGEQNEAFRAAAIADHVEVTALTSISGFNYAKGRRITLTLYRRAAP